MNEQEAAKAGFGATVAHLHLPSESLSAGG